VQSKFVHLKWGHMLVYPLVSLSNTGRDLFDDKNNIK
jgi:hypothetical protein